MVKRFIDEFQQIASCLKKTQEIRSILQALPPREELEKDELPVYVTSLILLKDINALLSWIEAYDEKEDSSSLPS